MGICAPRSAMKSNPPAPTSGSQLQLGPWAAGYGASAVAILTAGVVTGIKITHMGKNYSSVNPPTATLVDGTYVALGQVCMVNKAAQQAGLGIGNVRVIANNQIGITFINYTGAAIQPNAAETYLVLAINDLPAISPSSEVGLTVTSTSPTATSQTVTEVQVTASGMLATDMPSVPNKPTTTAGIATVEDTAGATQ